MELNSKVFAWIGGRLLACACTRLWVKPTTAKERKQKRKFV
jgi:predicted outer membrane lipoprotein